jgi:DNA processing protein
MDPILRRAAISLGWRREVPAHKLWPILRARGGLDALLALPERDLIDLLGSPARAHALLQAPEDEVSERRAREAERRGMRIVTAWDEEYPPLLAEIADPPYLLFVTGNPARFRLPAVAIVGSRAASRYGRDVATELARDLSGAGVTVVSGFARGIDASAHAAATGGPGGTIAVLGCGLDVEYPREHADLKAVLRRGDLVLSEYLPGTPPLAENFPIRNRIIAGLASGVVVVEASRRSGSLITARLASEAGRDVFAVPGSVYSGTSAGTHELLRDGAILCRGVEDVLSELFPSIGGNRPAGRAPSAQALASLSGDAKRLLEVLRREEEASAEDLAAACELSAAATLAALFELEGAGLAVCGEAGRYGLTRT